MKYNTLPSLRVLIDYSLCRRQRAEGEPKKPLPTYLLFARDVRAGLKAENPNASVAEVCLLYDYYYCRSTRVFMNIAVCSACVLMYLLHPVYW